MATQVQIPFAPPLAVDFGSLNIQGLDPSAPAPATILKMNEQFELSAEVKFSGNAPLVQLLMHLPLTVQVDFYGESIGPGSEVKLPATITTVPGTSDYTVKTAPITPSGAGLTGNTVYKVAAVVTITAPVAFSHPIATGFIDGLTVQTYS
ncbi:hypothetical protein [Geitlerinema sp. PCC 9228]|jgi:hypothetical protein|uniref:hypothetical protein n=1 Tax=Geitlerinema sp. PCC 9228 TaxID=111611 RepID=UPI0008F99BF7|nr:hypothetical protein [Geitlerinema sp. PCC 9228]